MLNSAQERPNAWKDWLRTAVGPAIVRMTVPLLVLQNDVLKFDRTGVLYRIADDYFVLTASHVGDSYDLRFVTKNNIPLYVHMGDGMTPVCLVDQRVTLHGTETDILDVAAIHLTKAIADELLERKMFLQHNQVCLSGRDHRLFLLLIFSKRMDFRPRGFA